MWAKTYFDVPATKMPGLESSFEPTRMSLGLARAVALDHSAARTTPVHHKLQQ
jgi:hypothetical protein